MGWVTRKKYCEREGIKFGAFKKRKAKGLIQWRFGASGRGGEAGKHIEIWIEEQKAEGSMQKADCEIKSQGDDEHKTELPDPKLEKISSRIIESSTKWQPTIGTKQIARGEPGCHVETPIVNGIPIEDGKMRSLEDEKLGKSEDEKMGRLEHREKTPEIVSTPNLPTIYNDTKIVPASCQRIANFRYALIQKFNEELTKEDPNLPLFKNGNGKPSKTKIIQKFLELYNSDFILPEVHKTLKTVKRSTLYDWLHIYNDRGIDGLIPQYRGPQSSGIAPAEKEFLRTKLLDQNKPTIGHAINRCKYLLGDESPSSEAKLRRWVNDFRKNNYDIWVLEREGEKALNDKCVPYAEREWRDLSVGEAVVADGHKLNFQVINPFTGKPTRAIMVLFWDWKSAYPLGWEIMLTESIQCVLAALRNSIITLGKFPDHALLDNGKAFRANIFRKEFRFQETEIPGIFERLSITPHFAAPYNAQSKPIERFFRTFNDWFERELPSYSGASIPDKPAYMNRNEKRAKELHNDWVPTIPEAMELIFRWREYYADQKLRARDGQRPRDIFEAEKGAGVDPFALHFLMMTCKARMVHRNGITFNGWHWYHENLYGLKDYVFMFYSYYDLSQLYIFTMRNGSPDQFLCVAKPVEKVKPFAADSEFPEDMAAVNQKNALKRKSINLTKKLADMLQSEKQVYIDWNRKFRDRPEVAEAIKQIEDKKPKVERLFPFIENEEVASSQPSPARSEGGDGRPWFYNDYDKHDWLMAHPEKNTEIDQQWDKDFRSRSSLYKNAVAGER